MSGQTAGMPPVMTGQPMQTQLMQQAPVFAPQSMGANMGAAPVLKPAAPAQKPLWMIILLIIAGLAAVSFMGLFIWMWARYDNVSTDVEGQITAAVATAKKETADALENEFAEKEKYPYSTFAGPADYGELSFQYPKTWSVYEERDASTGGEYSAYLNPDKVLPLSTTTVMALRVMIKDQSYDTYIRTLEDSVKAGKMTMEVRVVGGVNVNVYTGEIPTSALQGIIAVMKIRDKTAVLQTDSGMVFANDFYNVVLSSVKFNS